MPLESLLIPFTASELVDGERTLITPEVKIIKPSRFSITAMGGFARFNSNPGFLINGGLFNDVDRILDLEANIGFVYGSEQQEVFIRTASRIY